MIKVSVLTDNNNNKYLRFYDVKSNKFVTLDLSNFDDSIQIALERGNTMLLNLKRHGEI